MSVGSLASEVNEALLETPILDAHTHLVGDQRGACGLHDVLQYSVEWGFFTACRWSSRPFS